MKKIPLHNVRGIFRFIKGEFNSLVTTYRKMGETFKKSREN
jgi:hypothetical protein